MPDITSLVFSGHLDQAHSVADQKSELTIHEAAILGRWQTLKQILDADPSQISTLGPEGFSPLHFAGAFRHFDCAVLLVRYGADLNVLATSPFAQNTPTGATAFGGDPQILHLLLAAGANPNIPDTGGFTPLHLAAQNGNQEMVELLLRFGADKEALADGKSPADFARKAGHEEVAVRTSSC